jgi:hypothetical protein
VILKKMTPIPANVRLESAKLVTKAMCRHNYGGVVYLLSCADKYIKIGFTKGNPKVRCAELAKGCPLPLDIKITFPGGKELEQVLHHIFHEYHHKDEWFELRGELNDFCQWAMNENLTPAI